MRRRRAGIVALMRSTHRLTRGTRRPARSPAGPAAAPLDEQLGDLGLGVAGRQQHRLGVLAERRAGQPRVLAGRAPELDRDAELAHGPLGAGLLDLDDHLALAHELGGERLVELEHRLEAAVVLARERLPLGARRGP